MSDLPTDEWGWPIFSEVLEGVFVDMIRTHISDLTNGNLHKGRFIGMYVERLRELDSDHSNRYKYPYFVSKKSSERENNWLDYIISMDDGELEWFVKGLEKH